MRSKGRNFLRAVRACDYDVICLTETWWKDGIFSHEYFDDRFLVLRRDRCPSTYNSTGDDDDIRGGGVCIAIRKSPNYNVIHQIKWQCNNIEDLWVSIIPHHGKALHINCSYIPGITPVLVFDSFLSNLTDRIISLSDSDVIVLGDQNVPEFLNENLPKGSKVDSLNDFMDICGISQFNLCSNQVNGNILDLVFSNNFISVKKSSELLVKPDIFHPPLYIEKSFEVPKVPDKIKVFRRWKSADWAAIRRELYCIHWNVHLNCALNVNDLVDTFYDIVTDVLNRHCPLVVRKIKNSKPFLSVESKRLLRKKRQAFGRWHRSQLPEDYNIFCKLQTLCDKSLAYDTRNEISKIEKGLQSNPKKFWSFVNNRKSNGAGVADFVTLDESVADNKEDAANLFATHFSSVYSCESVPSCPPTSDLLGEAWNSVEVTPDTVFNKLSRLNINKGAGPDGFPPLFFKKCAKPLVFPLVAIYNASLKQGVMPQKWKLAYVVPIHKSGSQNDVRNYRPISKLSVIAKILDSIIADEVSERFKDIISTKQHGFFKRRSTVTNLASYTAKLQRCILSGGQLDVVYTDFSKAFDKVLHDVLINKLSHHGIGGTLLLWFKSYLKGRKQRVQLGDALSRIIDVTSSIVQGSHLGPILFCIFINDLANMIDIDFNCFADDVKLFTEVNDASDSLKLQTALNKLAEFSRVNGLVLNVDKCFVASFTRRTRRFICVDYRLDNKVLHRQHEMKDLGVVYDSKCTFLPHIEYSCKKAKRVLGFIMRNSKDFSNVKTVTTLYSSLVRSHLEYASIIWSPLAKVRIAQIEKVQHKFLIFIARKFFNISFACINYKDLLHKLSMDTLETRRVFIDVCFVVKSFRGLIDSQSFLHYFNFHIPSRRTRNLQVFKNSNFDSFLDRLMKNFNNYCNDYDTLINNCSIDSIKNYVKSKLQSGS